MVISLAQEVHLGRTSSREGDQVLPQERMLSFFGCLIAQETMGGNLDGLSVLPP